MARLDAVHSVLRTEHVHEVELLHGELHAERAERHALEARVRRLLQDRDRAMEVARELALALEERVSEHRMRESVLREEAAAERSARTANTKETKKDVDARAMLTRRAQELEEAAKSLQDAAAAARDEARSLRDGMALARREAEGWKTRCMAAEARVASLMEQMGGSEAVLSCLKKPVSPSPIARPQIVEGKYREERDRRVRLETELRELRERTAAELRMLSKALDDQVEVNAKLRVATWRATAKGFHMFAKDDADDDTAPPKE
jgi:chromosome segregation ATPase